MDNGNLLEGMRVVEAAAFVAAPLGGMTLAQMGADVIRIDTLGGGLDYRRWPVTEEWHQPVLGRPQQGKASVALDLRFARGQGGRDGLDRPPHPAKTRACSSPTSRRAAGSTTTSCASGAPT
jgi:crotonobetainyl-CoA:carnitine CoA-transferase CaiB-like acyl-CoA transferase